MSKSVYELAMFWSGRSGCFEAATTNLLRNPSKENVKYWSARMAEWDQERAKFFGEEVASEEVTPDIIVPSVATT